MGVGFSGSSSPWVVKGKYIEYAWSPTDVIRLGQLINGESWSRMEVLSTHAGNAFFINIPSGKTLYFGEDGDTGDYLFRGRNLIATQGDLGMIGEGTHVQLFESGGITDDFTVLTDLLGGTTTLHFLGGVFTGHD